jgi:hypothetical protein
MAREFPHLFRWWDESRFLLAFVKRYHLETAQTVQTVQNGTKN